VRTRQNDSRLDELASKVSALRGITVDIYDSARDQHVIDSTVRSTCVLTLLELFQSHSPNALLPPLSYLPLSLFYFVQLSLSYTPPYFPSSYIPPIPVFKNPPLTHPSLIVRNLFLLQHVSKGQRNAANAHGSIGEQSRDTQALRHIGGRDCVVVLDISFGVLGYLEGGVYDTGYGHRAMQVQGKCDVHCFR
jgi:hypothetical protein